MPEFVLCEHPDLPGQTALLPSPRNGWRPVNASDTPRRRRTAKAGKKSPRRARAALDSPTAGPSDTTKDEE